MPKRLLSGVIVSAHSKTIVVEVTKRVRHKLYKKIIKRTKKYHAHDENNEHKIGDKVTIQECRPISKIKTWIVHQAKLEESN
jgi:small subunit ribosomal protein S17